MIVDIAATDWPHFYPDFFSHLLEFLRRKETLILGLSMLLITSEELATPRDNVSSSRKEELKKLLNSQVPMVGCVIFLKLKKFRLDLDYSKILGTFDHGLGFGITYDLFSRPGFHSG